MTARRWGLWRCPLVVETTSRTARRTRRSRQHARARQTSAAVCGAISHGLAYACCVRAGPSAISCGDMYHCCPNSTQCVAGDGNACSFGGAGRRPLQRARYRRLFLQAPLRFRYGAARLRVSYRDRVRIPAPPQKGAVDLGPPARVCVRSCVRSLCCIVFLATSQQSKELAPVVTLLVIVVAPSGLAELGCRYRSRL
jgi:hypothetical protein